MALINFRNALMTGRRLPYDAESEYLESDGNAYAVVPNNIFSKHTGLRVELTLSTGSATLSAVSVLLAACGNIQGPPYYYRVAIDKTAQFASPGVNWFSLFTDGNVHTVSTTNVNLTNTGIYTDTDVDGTTVLRGVYSNANKTFDDTVGIFAFNNGNNKCPAGIRIYSIVAFDENGNKTADFIPVRKGTVGYLYDRVSGKLFGNAGTGDFVLGQDVVPVEYLKGDGNAYINTGVPCAFTDTYKVVAGYNENTRASALFGAAWAVRSVFVQMGTTPRDVYWHGMNPSSYHQLADGMNTIICGNGYITINGVTTTGSNYLNANEGNEIYLLGNSSFFSGSGPAKARVSNFTITSQGGDDKLRLLSVRVGTDATSWEGAMMDTLTRRIYRNAGTGAFTYGNDLKYPIPAS